MCYDAVRSYIRSGKMSFRKRSRTDTLFFNEYSSDCARTCSSDESILYADDISLVFVGTLLDELKDHISNRLRTTLEWCTYDKIALSPLKSEFSVVTNKLVVARP